MTREERQSLREVAARAARGRSEPPADPGTWKLQTSNSFRRIGMRGDGDVLCGTAHRIDGHPDLLAPLGVLEYIVAAQPHVVLALLDDLERCEETLALSHKQHAEDHAELERCEETLSLSRKQHAEDHAALERCEETLSLSRKQHAEDHAELERLQVEVRR